MVSDVRRNAKTHLKCIFLFCTKLYRATYNCRLSAFAKAVREGGSFCRSQAGVATPLCNCMISNFKIIILRKVCFFSLFVPLFFGKSWQSFYLCGAERLALFGRGIPLFLVVGASARSRPPGSSVQLQSEEKC